jgi:ribosomal protein L32E
MEDDQRHDERRTFSETDERVIKYLSLIAQTIQDRANKPFRPEKPKTLGVALKDPAVLAALVTVLIGGIAATCITGIIQWRAQQREFQQSQMARERDFEQAWLRSRGDQALISYKEYLDQERQLITRAYGSIGACIAASDRLVGLTGDEWRQHFADRALVSKQREEIRNSYNQTDAKWQSEAQEIGLLMSYYHPNEPKIAASWANVEQAVTDYLDSAHSWSKDHPANKPAPTNNDVRNACKAQYQTLVTQLDDLTKSLESARRYAWTGWESPQDMKALLHIASR